MFIIAPNRTLGFPVFTETNLVYFLSKIIIRPVDEICQVVFDSLSLASHAEQLLSL